MRSQFGSLGVSVDADIRWQDYDLGIIFCLCVNVLMIAIVCMNAVIFTRQNKRADRGEVVLEGDPNFRYTL